MLEWAKKQIETVLGKTIAGIIGIFILGAIVAWSLPKWIVTTEAFAQEVKKIYTEIYTGDKWQELKVIELRKDIWLRQQYDLEDKFDTQDKPPTVRQQNRMQEIKGELEKLKQEEIKAKEFLRLRYLRLR